MSIIIEDIDEAIRCVENEYGFVTDVLRRAKQELLKSALLLQEIGERIERARKDLGESSSIDKDSYGAGYDQGYLDANGELLELITEPQSC